MHGIRTLAKSFASRTGHASLFVGSLTAVTLTMGSSQIRCLAQAAATMPLDSNQVPVTLYQYEPCPYCCKVKAVLDFYKVPYHVVEVNPLTKKETKFSDYDKVPLAMINGQEVRDSNDIINSIQSQFGHKSQGGESISQQWVDTQFIRLMPPNIYRTIPESLQAFDYVLTEGKFTWGERTVARYIGAGAMYLISKKLKTKYEIDDPREALYRAVDEYLATMAPQASFAGGADPNLSDVMVFGVLRSIEGLDTFDDLMRHSPDIQAWFGRMVKAVGTSSRIIENESVSKLV